MTASEMHVMFRQYAQQMGMQNVRAILPEQIDLLLNTSVMDVVNQLIKENIGVTNDRIITDNSKIGQINALRSLYHVITIDMSPDSKDDLVFAFIKSNAYSGLMTTDFTNSKAKTKLPNYMFLVDFSLNYKQATIGYTGNIEAYVSPTFNEDALVTNYFPVRIIDDAYLADTLNDFVLKNRLRSPIIVTYNNNNNNVFDLYIDKFTGGGTSRYLLKEDLVPYKLRMSYIGKPVQISYAEDLGNSNVDCDLPEYMHVDIVKHAVDLYRMAISSSVMSAQNQQKAQTQENLRNNYRDDNQQAQ